MRRRGLVSNGPPAAGPSRRLENQGLGQLVALTVGRDGLLVCPGLFDSFDMMKGYAGGLVHFDGRTFAYRPIRLRPMIWVSASPFVGHRDPERGTMHGER
jgi:hypothetical protein